MNSKVITNPATTAPMEMRLLTVLERRVKSVITVADSSGRNKMSQGKIANFIEWAGNNQHPTSNIQHRKQPRAGHWMFGVGCWLLDVSSFNQSFIEVKSSTCADWRLR